MGCGREEIMIILNFYKHSWMFRSPILIIPTHPLTQTIYARNDEYKL